VTDGNTDQLDVHTWLHGARGQIHVHRAEIVLPGQRAMHIREALIDVTGIGGSPLLAQAGHWPCGNQGEVQPQLLILDVRSATTLASTADQHSLSERELCMLPMKEQMQQLRKFRCATHPMISQIGKLLGVLFTLLGAVVQHRRRRAHNNHADIGRQGVA